MTKSEKPGPHKRKRVGSKVRLALSEKRKNLVQHLDQLLASRTRLVDVIKNQPIEIIRAPDGLKIKVRSCDPMVDQMDWDNEREIARVTYEICKIDELLNPVKGRPRDSMYESAFQDQQVDPNITVAELAQKYFPCTFPVANISRSQ